MTNKLMDKCHHSFKTRRLLFQGEIDLELKYIKVKKEKKLIFENLSIEGP